MADRSKRQKPAMGGLFRFFNSLPVQLYVAVVLAGFVGQSVVEGHVPRVIVFSVIRGGPAQSQIGASAPLPSKTWALAAKSDLTGQASVCGSPQAHAALLGHSPRSRRASRCFRAARISQTPKSAYPMTKSQAASLPPRSAR